MSSNLDISGGRPFSRPALSGGMGWWSLPESEKYLSEAEFSRIIPEILQKERFLPDFSP